jgi:translation initiation factor 1A
MVYKKPAPKKHLKGAPAADAPIRVRTPKGKEVLGTVTQRLGGSRMYVACLDGKTRLARIPGRLKKSLWVRAGDIVLLEPWEFGGDEKADILWKYNKTQVVWLKQRGFLKQLSEFEEF